ncbi:MAG: 50S ribosomal protein L25 [Rhodothermales bacterium]|nr:50S ribosomal protein L25 [Rhodothermales bacterium]
MNTVKIEAQPRETGKSATRALRRSGNVPCVIYGHDADTVSCQMTSRALDGLVYTDERYRVEIQMGKDTFDCILKDVEFHPLLNKPVHADFQLLRAGEKIQLSIPVQFVGKSKGQKEGGDVQFLVHELEIEALPKDIPDHISVDITNLGIGDTLHVSDLETDGIEFVTPAAQSVVTCFVRKIELEPVEEVEPVEGELVEGEEGEAAEGAEAAKEQESSPEE